MCVAAALLLGLASGCGINKSRLATEQLVVTDAVDEAVSRIDFSPISGRTVYLDTSYLDDLKMSPYSNVEYVISSIRQQMAAYNCLIHEKRDQAEFVVELRLGALANDGDEVTYGIPSSSAKVAATAVPSIGSLLPPIPEISLGRRVCQVGTAKIGVFAYDRETREPVWQSGLATGTSEARDLWLLGLGPFQKGRIYKRMHSKSDTLERAIAEVDEEVPQSMQDYGAPLVFERATRPRGAQPAKEGGLAPIVSAKAPPKETEAGAKESVTKR